MTARGRPRLLLVEGLPGAGKTTLAQHLAADVEAKGEEVALYLEGDLHPCDLQWISRMYEPAHQDAVDRLHQAWQQSARSEPWEHILARLQQFSTVEDGFVLTAYTKLDFADTELWGAIDPFRNSEVHDARVSLEDYRSTYRNRWQRFGDGQQHQAATCVFECAFLQSHVTELLAHHRMEADEIIDFLTTLLEPVRHMWPELYYVQPADYPRRIREAAATRGDWLESLIAYIAGSAYGRDHGLEGFDGAMAFFSRRAEIERMAMEWLGLPVHVIPR